MPFKNDYIDKDVPIPMYYQLKEIIRKKINDGIFKPGDLLPTEAEFSEMFDLSRTTIRQAIMDLVSDGYLYRVKAKGTYVAKPKINQNFMQYIEPFDEQMKRLKMETTTNVLFFDVIDANEEVARALDIQISDRVVYLQRVRHANGEPIMLLDTFLPLICKDILDEDMTKVGVTEFMTRRPETKIVRAIRQIEAVLTGQAENRYLNIPIGHPLQLVTSYGFNNKGRNVEYSIVKYRGDKNKFTVEVRL